MLNQYIGEAHYYFEVVQNDLYIFHQKFLNNSKFLFNFVLSQHQSWWRDVDGKRVDMGGEETDPAHRRII